MATLTAQRIIRAGLDPAYAAAAGGGDDFQPGPDVFVHIKNASGGSITATFVTPREVEGLAVADLAVAIPAGDERMVGPFDAATYADPSTGLCPITYSGVTSLTVGVFRL